MVLKCGDEEGCVASSSSNADKLHRMLHHRHSFVDDGSSPTTPRSSIHKKTGSKTTKITDCSSSISKFSLASSKDFSDQLDMYNNNHDHDGTEETVDSAMSALRKTTVPLLGDQLASLNQKQQQQKCHNEDNDDEERPPISNRTLMTAETDATSVTHTTAAAALDDDPIEEDQGENENEPESSASPSLTTASSPKKDSSKKTTNSLVLSPAMMKRKMSAARRRGSSSGNNNKELVAERMEQALPLEENPSGADLIPARGKSSRNNKDDDDDSPYHKSSRRQSASSLAGLKDYLTGSSTERSTTGGGASSSPSSMISKQKRSSGGISVAELRGFDEVSMRSRRSLASTSISSSLSYNNNRHNKSMSDLAAATSPRRRQNEQHRPSSTRKANSSRHLTADDHDHPNHHHASLDKFIDDITAKSKQRRAQQANDFNENEMLQSSNCNKSTRSRRSLVSADDLKGFDEEAMSMRSPSTRSIKQTIERSSPIKVDYSETEIADGILPLSSPPAFDSEAPETPRSTKSKKRKSSSPSKKKKHKDDDSIEQEQEGTVAPQTPK